MSTYFETEETEYKELVSNKVDGVIKAYPTSKGLQLPYIMIEIEQMTVGVSEILANMLVPSEYRAIQVREGNYNVYVKTTGGVVLLGELEGRRLKGILQGEVFKEFPKYMCVEQGVKVVGDMMYAFCTREM